MKRILDSFIKNIVRQSLNESYGLLNEYNFTTTTQIGDIPKGTTINNMILSECPDGGFCYSTLDQAKKDFKEKGVQHWNGLIQTYCPSKTVSNRKGKGIKMGNPTFSTHAITTKSRDLWIQLTDYSMDSAAIKRGLMGLENFPNFCKSEELFHSNTNVNKDGWNGFEGNSSYGINNDDSDDSANYYDIIAQLFENSIVISDLAYAEWLTELNAKYKVIKDAAAKNEQDKKNKEEKDKKIKGGGGQYVEWVKKHPAISKTSEIIKTDIGDANLYSLNTNDSTIDLYKYGVLYIDDPNNTNLNGTYQDVKVKDGTDLALNIDPETDSFWQYAISQNNVWRYDDVVWSNAYNKGDGGKLALTTSPDLEDDGKINNTIQTERTKGFRYNLLTEIELKLKDTGEEVGKIQKKLGLPAERNPTYGPITKTAVEKFQKDKNIPVTGIVDQATYDSIMAIPDPIVPSATGYTRELTIGSKGPDVDAIQTKLNIKTGKYGPETQTAVLNYQKNYTNLVDTGIVDKTTFDHIIANTKLSTPSTFSGKKHNYKKGDWIVVKPNPGNEATQLYENNGYFEILNVPDEYTIIINADWQGSGYATIGGTTAKIIFGPEAVKGVKTMPTVSDNPSNKKEKGTRNNTSNSSNNSGTNTEKPKQRDVRNKEFCDNFRQVKQYINNTKGGDLTVNCKKTQKTLNQIMLALTGGTPVPIEKPVNNVVTSVPLTDKLF